LRLLIVGSEPVDPSALATWCRTTGIPVINAYGLTETTITALCHEVSASFDDPIVPVGTPLNGVTAYVLDPELRPVPATIDGELYIGGVALANGYLGDPARTADRFVPDPYADGTRMHRTGDRARRRPDGTIEVLGRLDDQLKFNGYRVEPRQVEIALAAHPKITQAAATVHNGPDGTPRLCGYVVPGVPDDLRDHLAVLLPHHLIPTSLTALPTLPLTTSGKVDRAALPPPTFARAFTTAAPSTPWERRLATLWRDVLGVTELGVHDNFFDVGGNSAMLATLHRRLDMPIPLVELYQHPTIADLARHLSSAGTPPAAPQPSKTRQDLGRLAKLRRGRTNSGPCPGRACGNPV
jgi:hypothetical protein